MEARRPALCVLYSKFMAEIAPLQEAGGRAASLPVLLSGSHLAKDKCLKKGDAVRF